MLRFVAALSAVYDFLIGAALLAGRPLLVQLFGLPDPVPPIHADLNGLFAVAIAIGYALPYRDPEKYRGYLWVMGPGLKGAGALLFVADHLLRGSPASFLLFAAGDGSIALLTLWALLASRRPRTREQKG
ncbi:MAG: hypothetical protein WCP29_16290 [Acidobacteriota bacterium]